MKKRQNNDMIDHTSVDYAKIGTKMSWSISQDVVNHENQTGQRCDQS